MPSGRPVRSCPIEELIRCPACLGPLDDARGPRPACASCGAAYSRTPDGIPVLVDLTAAEGEGNRSMRAGVETLRETCRSGLEGKIEKRPCPPEVRRGPIYRRFVLWPVDVAIEMARVPDLSGARVLHIGAGMADEAEILAERGARFVALDLAASYLRCTVGEAADKALPYDSFLVGAAELLPFDDNSFDLVLLHKTVQWWIDPAAGLREAYRVGRRVLIIAEPAAGPVRRLGQVVGWARRASPITKRVINEVSHGWLASSLPDGARIETRRYLGKAIDSAEPRDSVVALDRVRPLAAALVGVLALTNALVGRLLGNQICAVVERPASDRQGT